VQPITGYASWSVEKSNGEITDIFDPNSGITGLTAGANIFRWYVNYGACPVEYDEVTIYKDTIGELPYAGKDVIFCDSIYTLNATPLNYGKGSWELISGSVTFGQVTNPKCKLSGISPGEHVLRWNADNGACASFFDEMKIRRELPLKQVFAGKDTALCARELYLNAKAQLYVQGRWRIIAGSAQIMDSTKEYSYIYKLAEGNNKLEWTAWNACNNKVKDTLIIKVHNAIKVDLGSDTTMYFTPNSPLALTKNNPASRGNGKFYYQWTPTNNLQLPNSSTGQFIPVSLGVYPFKLVVTDDMGCKDSGSRVIKIIQVEKIDAPTLFSPNGDGTNDLFILPGIESYPNNEFIVMDKLGQVVYKQKGYDNQWNGAATKGSYSGDILPDDTYFYVLDLGEGKDKVQTGFIVIKK
jgi:gliding motility-associated-like protein